MFDKLISIVYIYTYPLLVRAKRGEKIIAPQGPMHRQSLCRYNPISTNPRSLCSENPRRVAPTQILAKKIPRTQPSSGRDHPPNAQTAGELCVDKTQSAQICNLCVEKNPRPRRARTNSGRAQLLIGKTIIGRCSNNFLLENRPIIVFPIRKTPVRILAKKTGSCKIV